MSYKESDASVLNELSVRPPTTGSDTPTYVLTPEGKLVYDKVLLAFYPDEVKQWLKDREQSAVARGRLQAAQQS